MEEKKRPDESISRVWFIVSSCLCALFVTLLAVWPNMPDVQRTSIFLLGCGCFLWLGTSIQIRFKNRWMALPTMITGIALMLVALGAISPGELFDHAKGLLSK